MEALDLMLARRSIRRFTGEDVSAEDEEALVEAAFAAPSASNERPWHFIVVRDPTTRRRLRDIHRYTWMLDKAPLVIAVLGKHEGHPWWIEDCSAATENILLQATALGLGSVWCGMRELEDGVTGAERTCCEILGVPIGPWRVLALIGVGHPAEAKAPRSQRQVSKLSYEGFGRRAR